jgi:hypothetical protein
MLNPNLQHRPTAIVLLALAVLLLSGCGTPTVHVTRSAPGPAVRVGKVQKVYDLGDRVDQPYEILGVVSASGNRAAVRSKARKLMLTEAETLGAEALVGYYYDQEITVSTGDADGWAGALAVKFLPDGAAAPGPSQAVVVLPHTVIGEDLGTGKKAEKADAIARKHARLLLAKKGYYAVFTDDVLAPGFPDQFKNLNAAERNKYGSPEADLVLAVNLGDRHAFNALFAAAASQALGTALYSKSADAVTWDNTGKGNSFDFTTDLGLAAGVGHLFVPSAKTVRSVHAALVKAFETLPDLTQPATPR